MCALTNGMNEKSVFAVILVLICLPFGKGDENITKARSHLRKCYYRIIPYSKDPNILRPARTLFSFLNEVEGKDKTWQNQVQLVSGYSPEQLSNPPESFMSEDELKLATEYQLLQSGRYHMQFIALNKAAQFARPANIYYPSAFRCRNAASRAYRLSQFHRKKYSNYYEALSNEAQLEIMVEIEFPSLVDLVKHNHENPEPYVDLKVKLENLIRVLLNKKNVKVVKSVDGIQRLLTPSRGFLNSSMMSMLRNRFVVEDLSQPPDKASRSDGEFLEVAWLFNQYRSLWHEIRYNEFLKSLRVWKSDMTDDLLQRIDDAMKVNMKLFRCYRSLSKAYYKVYTKYQSETVLIAQDTPLGNPREIPFQKQDESCAPQEIQGPQLSEFDSWLKNHLLNTVHAENNHEPDLPRLKVDLFSPQSKLLTNKLSYDSMEMNYEVNKRMGFSGESDDHKSNDVSNDVYGPNLKSIAPSHGNHLSNSMF